MKLRAKIFISVTVLFSAAIVYALYLYKKQPINPRQHKPDVSITASELSDAFHSDETAANKKFVDKIIEVSGKVKDISSSPSGQVTIFLETTDALSLVACTLDASQKSGVIKTQPSDSVTIKGMCTGVLIDVILNKCSMVD